MKKKALSLALALALCLGLTVPALAAEAGTTTLKDDAGYSYTLSQPIVGTRTMEEGWHYDVATGDTATNVVVYQISEGTIITPVCPEGKKTVGEYAGTRYELTNEEGLKQAGSVISADSASRAGSFFVTYGKMDVVDSWGMLGYVGDLEGTDEDGAPTQPLPQGLHLIGREIFWIYRGVGGASAGEGKTSYLYIEVVPKGQPAPAVKPASASPTNDSLLVDGKSVVPTAYKIDGSNYFKLRDVAALLDGSAKQFAVGYENGTITLTTGQSYAKQPGDLTGAATGGSKQANPSNDAVTVNGQAATLTAYKIDGSNYFKLRDLGEALGFTVGWDGQNMLIETNK